MELLTLLEAGSSQVVTLIDDVLTLAAMEKGTFALHWERCHLARCCCCVALALLRLRCACVAPFALRFRAPALTAGRRSAHAPAHAHGVTHTPAGGCDR